jgi:GNAT superfamily N-acetyltransferase
MALLSPSMRETDALLTNGACVHLRPIQPGDIEALIAFHAGLSPQTIHRRFFNEHQTLSTREAEHFCVVDYRERFAVVALVGTAIIGVARYERHDTNMAEVAFVVTDAYQGHGLGPLLLRHLVAAAREVGIDTFDADTLADNGPMLAVVQHSGFPIHTTMSDGVVHVRLSLDCEASALS